MSDAGKLDKPPIAQAPPKAETATPSVGGLSAGAGFQAVMAQRTQAVEQVRYRMTGGEQGIAPAGHFAAERRAIVGGAAARIMRKKGGDAAGGAEVPKGSGAALPGEVRARMEPKLGADLSGVRVHTGGESATAASGFGARAFTVGSDVHFNAGEFSPGTKEGDKLLAHELTHVVQGQKSGVQRKAEAGEEDAGHEHGDHGSEVSSPEEPAEVEADAISEKVAGELHDGGDEKAEKKGAEKKGGEKKAGDKKGGEEKAGEKKAEAGAGNSDGPDAKQGEKPSEKPAAIAAKLDTKVFRAKAPKTPAPGGTQELKSPSGKPAKEGEVQGGGAPALQLYGYGGVRKVGGVLVKDMEKELKSLEEKEAAAKKSGPKLTPQEVEKKGKYKLAVDDVNKTKGEDYLIFAGHIGVSLDGGATIYGFTPVAPEGMPKEQVIGHLHAHTMAFPGAVKNDKAHFDLATRCASTKQWDTDVTAVTRPVTTAVAADCKRKLQEMQGMAPGAHGIYYAFPSDATPGQYFADAPGPDGKIVKGENQANCATFPAKIGIELPEQSGNLRFFMPALRKEAGANKP